MFLSLPDPGRRPYSSTGTPCTRRKLPTPPRCHEGAAGFEGGARASTGAWIRRAGSGSPHGSRHGRRGGLDHQAHRRRRGRCSVSCWTWFTLDCRPLLSAAHLDPLSWRSLSGSVAVLIDLACSG